MCSSPHWQIGSSWFSEKLSPANRNKGYCGEQISRKIVSRELNARSCGDFARIIALLGTTSAKFAKLVGKKMGSNMRPRYISNSVIYTTAIYRAYTVTSIFPQSPTYAQRQLISCATKACTWHSTLHDNHFNEIRHSDHSSGPRLNIKTVLSTYGDFHVKDKTAVRTSYL